MKTICGCDFKKGSWIVATCEHGREWSLDDGGQLVDAGTDRPIVICLCGSTRFWQTFQKANNLETMKGNIVLSAGLYPHTKSIGILPEQKEALDVLHFRKIDMADEVLILNVGGYIGASTARELAYARATGKTIRFWEEN